MEDCYFVPLMSGRRYGKHKGMTYTYSTDLWAPFCLPIKGVYDDYGRIEDWEETPALDILQNYIVQNIVEYEDGIRSVKKSDMSSRSWLLHFQNALSLGRGVKVSHPQRQLGGVFIRADVYESLAAMDVLGYKNEVYGIDSCSASIKKYAECFKAYLDAMAKVKGGSKEKSSEELSRIMFLVGELFRASQAASPFPEGMYAQLISEQVLLDEAVEDAAKLLRIMHYVGMLRKIWHPTAIGSRDDLSIQLHKDFAKIVSRCAANCDFNISEMHMAHVYEKILSHGPYHKEVIYESNYFFNPSDIVTIGGQKVLSDEEAEIFDSGVCFFVICHDQFDYLFYDHKANEWLEVTRELPPDRETLKYCRELTREELVTLTKRSPNVPSKE